MMIRYVTMAFSAIVILYALSSKKFKNDVAEQIKCIKKH